MITKVSEITAQHIADYINLNNATPTELDSLDNFLNIAKNYIKDYTGLINDDVDAHNDLIIVVYILCQDMYDTRSLYVEKSNLNKVVESILNMHCVNRL